MEEVRKLNPDLICVVAYGKILPQELLDIPKYGCVNVHGSLLPEYRGAAPIQWAVLNGDKKTGVTTMFMNAGMDTGDMILKEEVEIGEDETTGELWDRLKTIGANLLIKTVKEIENGTATRTKQPEEGTMAPMLSKEMAKIDWENKTAQEIKNLVRGLNPIMGAYTFLDGKKIKFWKVQTLTENELLENWITQKDEMNEELSVSEWKEFEIKELFETSQLGKEIQVPTGAYVKRKDLDDGDVPRITVSGINNGVTGWYSSNDSNYKVYNNFISVSFLNTVFYQEGDASLDMKVHCLKPKDIELNKYVALFLVSVIRKTIYFSSYADQISSTVLPQIRIKLPVESNGNPDYEYMENYIKSLPYGDII